MTYHLLPKLDVFMFADDTTIYYIGEEVEEIVDALNLILNDFNIRIISLFTLARPWQC